MIRHFTISGDAQIIEDFIRELRRLITVLAELSQTAPDGQSKKVVYYYVQST